MLGLDPLRALVLPVGTLTGGFALFFLLGTFVFSGHNPRSSTSQPIAFNHAKHIENGLGCTDCHVGAETQEHATLPELATCLTCHETALTESREEEKVRALAAAHRELKWVQVNNMPSHVYFSHRRHVVLAKIACADCHGPMDKATSPPTKPFRQLDMDECIACHAQNHARTDCNDCHR